jgi:hypothetical protein
MGARHLKKGINKRPKKSISRNDVVSQSDINQQIKAAKAKAKALLAKANTDIKSVRKDVAALKKAGIVSKRVDVRRYQPTRYMLNKIKQNADILKGEAIAVKAAPEIRKKYREAGTFETRGATIIVPKDRANQTAKISRGLVETRTRLKNGEERKIILPFKGKDLKDIAERLAVDESLGGLKDPLELFGARIFGHNIAGGFGFPDADELGNYILRNYNHLFAGKNKQAALQNFELVRFVADDSMMQESKGVIDDEYRKRNKQGNQWAIDRRKERDALRKAALRKKETDEQRANRLAAQRERSARNRANKKGK